MKETYQRLSKVLVGAIVVIATGASSASDIIEQNVLKRIAVKGESPPAVTLQQRMQDFNVPGLSIAVVQQGEIVWAKGYGIANAETQNKVTTDTLFQAGSISKPVAALAALKLVEQGKLELDSDVNDYLKSWQVSGPAYSSDNPVTLRHLLTHTGGLSVHGFPGYDTGAEIPSTLGVLNGEGNTDAVVAYQTPGENWRYSGGGYTVMQLLVEEATSQSFAGYTDANILKPMDMSLSTYEHALPPTLAKLASGAFDQQGEMYEVVYNDYPEKAAAGLWTTPTDIAKYVIHMQSIVQGDKNGILQKPIVDAMFTRHQNDWGLGPEMLEINDNLIFGHGGKNLGFTNYFRASVNNGNAIIVMSNADNANVLNREVMTTLSLHYGFDLAEQMIIEPVVLSDDALKRFEGNYKMLTDIGYDGDYIASIALKEGNLFVKAPNEDTPSRIVPTDELHFTSLESGNPFVFSIDDSGNITGLKVAGRFELSKL